MYFRLNPECYLIMGKMHGAIFDLIETKLYALNQQETEIIKSCEKNNPIREEEEFLNDLKRLRLGNFYQNRIYMQKLRVGSAANENDIVDSTDPPELHRVFLEINNSCNRNCWYCGYYGVKRSLGCMGCNKWKNDDEPLSLEGWKKVIDEICCLDCRELFITGGDLTLAWDRTMDIIDYARGKVNNINVILHQENLSQNIKDDLADKANIIVQTEDLYKVEQEDLTILLIKLGDEEFTSCLNRNNIIIDIIIDTDKPLSSNLPVMTKKKILPTDVYKFFNNVEYHPCLGHTLSICYNGDVIPCPMMRTHCFGNAKDEELHYVFKKSWERISKFWRLNLDEIDKCTGCEFRYACDDCRALEESLTKKLDGKILCSYDPEKGEWQ